MRSPKPRGIVTAQGTYERLGVQMSELTDKKILTYVREGRYGERLQRLLVEDDAKRTGGLHIETTRRRNRTVQSILMELEL